MADYRDPAIRLLNIMRQLKAEGDQTRTRDAWARALGLAESTNEVLFPRLGKVLLLPEQIRKDFDRRGIRQQPILKALPKVERALTYLHLDGSQMKNIKAALSDDALLSLEIAHDQLAEGLPAQDVEDDALQALLDSVRVVLDQALASTVDDRVKRFVVDGLRRLEQAIVDFKIDGGEAIERLVRCAVGEVLTDPELVAAHRNRDQRVSWFWKSVERAGWLATSTTLALNLIAGGDPSVVVEGDLSIEVLQVIGDLPEPPALPGPSQSDDTPEADTPDDEAPDGDEPDRAG